MSLQQQIQREMEEEAKREKKVAAVVKKVFKNSDIRRYRETSTRKGADGVFLLDRTDLNNYIFALNEENNEHLNKCIENPDNVVIFLRNKNPHDGRKSSFGDIRNYKPGKRKFYQ